MLLWLLLWPPPALGILCGNNECTLQAATCAQQPSQCEDAAHHGLIVMDRAHAQSMCAAIGMKLVSPADSAVNSAMFSICPSAGFFDIEAKQSMPGGCNVFVVGSTGEAQPYFIWGAGEPNNADSANNCSKGPIEEGCVAFMPASVRGVLRNFCDLTMHFDVSADLARSHVQFARHRVCRPDQLGGAQVRCVRQSRHAQADTVADSATNTKADAAADSCATNACSCRADTDSRCNNADANCRAHGYAHANYHCGGRANDFNYCFFDCVTVTARACCLVGEHNHAAHWRLIRAHYQYYYYQRDNHVVTESHHGWRRNRRAV